MVNPSRFVVGIDLGTTNNALAYIDTGAGDDAALQILRVPQVVQPGVVQERQLLPSFLYLPGPNEQPAGALRLPGAAHRDYAVGEFARVFGSQAPPRRGASAKPGLGHPGADPRQPLM